RPGGVTWPSSAASTLCVAGGSAGWIETSTDPTGGASAWKMAQLEGSNVAIDINCPSVTLCVGADSDGNVLISTNPTGGPSAWTIDPVDPGNDLGSVQCPEV